MSDHNPARPSKILPRLSWFIASIGFALFIALPIWQAVLFWNSSDPNFRPSFVGNWAATVLGVIGGIPVALALNRWWQYEQERTGREKAKLERTERETFVLNAIRNELYVNKGILEHMIREQEQSPSIIAIAGMRDVNWKALSDSGELRWVADLNILFRLSEAYYYINALIHYERQYANPYFNMSVSNAGGNSYAGANTVDFVNKIRPDALKYVKEAIEVVEIKTGSGFIQSQ